MKAIILDGSYKHADGTMYKVLRVEQDPVTQQDLVVYQSRADKDIVMTCTASDFLGSVTQNGNMVPCFTYIPVQTEGEVELELELDEETRRILIENDIDLAEVLERRFDHVRCEKRFPDNGAKELALVILCSCGGVAAVILAITNLVHTVGHLPRKTLTKITTLENGDIVKEVEYWQPDTRKTEFSLSTELGEGKAKLEIVNTKE